MKIEEIIIGDEKLFLGDEVQKSDVAKIMQLVKEVGVFSEEEIEVSGKLIADALNGEDYHFLFLRNNAGDIIAYSCFGEICMAKGRFDLYWLAVSKKWQGRKLASLILQKSEERIRAIGGKKLYAETSSLPEYSPARSFYIKYGFAQVAEINDFYKDGDNKVIFGKEMY
jgi:ribosomal protein S18 acetylase RimI-like enzyme